MECLFNLLCCMNLLLLTHSLSLFQKFYLFGCVRCVQLAGSFLRHARSVIAQRTDSQVYGRL